MLRALCAIFCFLFFSSRAQDFIGAKSFVKDKTVSIRWVPSSYSVLKQCIGAGYEIKRIQWSSDKLPDSVDFKNTSFSRIISPKKKEDAVWKTLVEKSDEAAFLNKVLYSAIDPRIKDPGMFFGLAMLGCDFNVELAAAAGLFFIDEASENRCAYLIRPADTKLHNSIKPGIIVVNGSKNDLVAKIDSLIVGGRKKEAKLTWKIENLKSSYCGYFIERSTNGKDFTVLNKKPHILITTQYEKQKSKISFNDTATIYGQLYYYRVRGLGFFGNYGEYSPIVKIRLVQPLNDYCPIDSVQLVKDTLFRVHWHVNAKIPPVELGGYNLYRANKDEGPYTKVNSTKIKKEESSFIDQKPFKTTFYKLVTYNTSGDSLISHAAMALIPDRSPPKIPKGLKAQIDTSGKVKLSWSANKESDLIGYRIFRNNAQDEELVEITKRFVTDTVFADTVDLNTLTEFVYYSITAVDQVYNNSPYSPTIKLKRPDKIKPVSVVFQQITHNDSMISVNWIPSSSNDVVKYELWRKKENGFIKVKEWTPKDSLNFYRDKDLEYSKYYQYKIRVIDEADNFSETQSQVHYYDSRLRKEIKDISFEVDRQKKTIVLKWNYPEKEIFSFVIYKAKKGEELRSFRTLKPSVTSLLDKELNIGNVYIYRIKANYNSGAESRISREIEITY